VTTVDQVLRNYHSILEDRLQRATGSDLDCIALAIHETLEQAAQDFTAASTILENNGFDRTLLVVQKALLFAKH
jgi:hypothetical protein